MSVLCVGVVQYMMKNGESSSESEGGDVTSADESSEDECKALGGGGTEDDVNNNDVSMKDISRDAGHEEVSRRPLRQVMLED